MLRNLQKGNRLLVISDTAMVVSNAGIKGYEPVIRELDSISNLFDEIVWLGFGFEFKSTPLILPTSSNIKLIPMPSIGGGGFLNKLKFLFYYFIYFYYILKYLPKSTHVHSRAPSHPSLIAMLISKFDKRRTYWHKYAGNWVEPNPPGSYAFQKKILEKIKNPKVFGTVNGYWPGQPKHILCFENPCLYEAERRKAEVIASNKNFNGKLSILYVGALSRFKGIIQLVESLKMLNNPEKFEELIIVGDGELRKDLEKMAANQIGIKINLKGFLHRDKIEELYKKAHIISLPSESEGFPKVIAEGAAYGCIPLTTNISSLGQYLKTSDNGFLIDDNKPVTIAKILNEISLRKDLKEISSKSVALCHTFTYEYFNERIRKEIL